MNEIVFFVEKNLKKSAVAPERFQQVVSRLLGRGIICYGDSQIESELYNDALRTQALLADFFSVIGAKLIHEQQFKYFRLYPPGVGTLSVELDDENVDHSMRESLTQHETACVLVLRLLYDQAVQEGNLDDQAEVHITMEALHTTLQTRLKRSLPERVVERKNIFSKLRRFKLIRMSSEDDLEKPESWLAIRPMIVGFVHADALDTMTPEATEAGNA
jgi:hypothetical protein